MTALVLGLLLLTALSLGLRTTSPLLGPAVHPLIRLAAAAAIGVIMVAAVLEACERYRIGELGLGLMLSLSPVGIFDLAKWWFRWRAAQPSRY